MLTGTNLQHTRAHNLRTVLETVRLFGPLSRKDVARRTALRVQTVSYITRQLMEARLIIETEKLREGRGAPTSLLDLNPDGAYSIGLDFDRDHFTGVLVNLAGQVRQRIAQGVRFPPPAEATELMVQSVNELIRRQDLPKERVLGVGVGLPGPLGISEGSIVTNIARPAAFPGWKNVPIAEILREHLGMPVFIERNALAAAVGERWYGRGRHIRNFVYLFFGIGLGAGLVIDGRPYQGHGGNAGEIGPIPTQSGRHAATGLENPHLGAFFSLPVLANSFRGEGIQIARPEDLGPFFDQRDKRLGDWLDDGIAQLAPFLFAVECLVDPEAIFLGGLYPENVLSYIRDRLEAILPGFRFEERLAHPNLYVATAGEDATALGVATLPVYSSFAPLPQLLLKNAADTPSSTGAPLVV